MAVNDVPPPIDLETGNWSPPSRWMGRVRGWVLLKWILWDPYALRAYAGLYIWAMRSSSLDGGNSQADPRRARLPFLIDVATLIGCVWFVLALFFTLLTMWWLPPDSLFFNALGSATLCAITSAVVLAILGWETDHWVVAAIWGFVMGIGAAALYWVEMGFREAPPELGVMLYFAFVVIFSSLMGVLLNSMLHGMARGRASRTALVLVRGIFLSFYFLGLLFYALILYNWIFRSWVPFTISIWYLLLGLIIGHLVVALSCWRIDDWLWRYQGPWAPTPDGRWTVSRVTTKLTPPVRAKLNQWLEDGGPIAMANIAHLWFYMNMRPAIQDHIWDYLDKRGDNEAVVQAVSSFVNRRFVFGLADLFPEADAPGFSFSALFSKDYWSRKFQTIMSAGSSGLYEQSFITVDCCPEWPWTKRFDSRAARIAAGFKLMDGWEFDQAANAFDGVSDSDSADELAQLVRVLKEFFQVEERLARPSYPPLPAPPSVQNRRDVWGSIRQLDEGIFYLWLRRRTQSSKVELQVAATERFGRSRGADLLEPEATLIRAIIWRYEWSTAVHQASSEGIINPPPVPNPYYEDSIMPGHPSYVYRDELVLGEDTLRYAPDLPIVVLTGLPGVGVSTLLADLGARLSMVRVSLTQIVDQVDAGENLIRKLMGEIAGQGGRGAPVNFTADNWRQTSLDYVVDAVASVGGRLTITIDDFEQAASLRLGRSSLAQAIDFIADLAIERVQGVSLVLAGHLTPAEVRGIAAEQVISLRLFDLEESTQLLEGPVFSRTLHYRVEALERIQAQTGGHPLLVRLLGEALVDRYNRSDPRDPVFSVEDVDAVIESIEFQSYAERKVYRSMIQIIQRINRWADALLTEIARFSIDPNVGMNDELASLMARQYGASAEQVQRTLDDLDELSLIARGELRHGQETWRMTIPLFQGYLRSR